MEVFVPLLVPTLKTNQLAILSISIISPESAFHSNHIVLQWPLNLSPCFLNLPFHSVLHTVTRVLFLYAILIGNIPLKIRVPSSTYRISPNLILSVWPFSIWSNITLHIYSFHLPTTSVHSHL